MRADIQTTIRRRGVYWIVLTWFAFCTGIRLIECVFCTHYVMAVRPALEEETVERLNSLVDRRMAVSPESVSIDERVKVLLDAYDQARTRNRS